MDKKSVFQNAKWIIGCKILQSLLNLIVGLLSARYLGPSNYGLISYAASVVGFVVPVMQLGMRSTLVQEYIARPREEGAVMGTALAMSLISSVACMLSVAAFCAAANPRDGLTLGVVVLYSLSLPFQAVEMTQYWFQAKLISKYPSMAMLGAYLVVSAYKIFLLISQKEVYWFAVSHALEYAVVGAALLVIYSRKKGQKLSFSLPLAGKLLARSKYYILSGMMTMVFANTDHIMLKLMVGNVENGYYSAALTSAGVFNFVYMAVIDSTRPLILNGKAGNQEDYKKNISGLYGLITYTALLQSTCFVVLADLIIYILYGSQYRDAVPVLQIVAWYNAFSYMGTIRNIWILAEGKQALLWRINLCGAAANVAMNAVLIPVWGACGAATASLLTQIFTNFILGFWMQPIRENNALLLKGMRPAAVRKFLPKFRGP